jgi:hypothetical protein
VPAGIFTPLTDIPAVIPAVVGVPTRVSVAPVAILALGYAVIDALADLNVMAVVGVTPPADRGRLSVTVVIATTLVTVVPGAIFVPLTGIPTPIPVPIPSKVNVDPDALATLGLALKGGMT